MSLGKATFAVLIIGALGGCDTTLSMEKYNEGVAKFAVLPHNKAMYINLQDYSASQVWGIASLAQAVQTARVQCETLARSHGTDPSRCTPAFVNETRVWDPSASAAMAVQEQQDFLNLMQQMQQIKR